VLVTVSWSSSLPVPLTLIVPALPSEPLFKSRCREVDLAIGELVTVHY